VQMVVRLFVCLCLFLVRARTMRCSRYGQGAFATHNHATRNNRGDPKGQ
jgi:hypothetical protein